MSERADWARVKSLFDAALDVPQAERERWIAEHCAGDPDTHDELRSLLAAQSGPRGDFLSRGSRVFARAFAAVAPASSAVGATIGPYAVLREIGSGGMGRVFLARRADGQYQRSVALKLIRAELASPELLRRFLRERDTLAQLAHPNIATLLDGGLADDAPYFTMEFVEGEPIDRWCEAQRLDVRARVALLVKICDAVQHAHRNLVVHRDIKPSNILVGPDGEPKLLDFGIAKPLATDAAADETGTTLHPMTREYAAPEQVLGEPITIATDEYALGVLLYRLLTGHMPYARAERGEISWPKAIVEEAPEPLERAIVRAGADGSTLSASRGTSSVLLRRTLRGDLENIVQRALAKSPDARYPTVGALAEDLRAFLDQRALSGDTRTFRARKFVQRHWLPLAAGVAALLAIVIGAAGIAFESHQRQLAAEQALHEAEAGAAVRDFVIGLFQKANPNETQGKVLTLRDAVDVGVRRLDQIPDTQPTLKGELQVTLAQIYFALDQYDQTITLASQAFDALKSRPEDTVLAARAERYKATALATAGDLAKAQPIADDAVARLRALAHPPADELGRTLYTASWVALKRSDLDRLKVYAEQAEALASQPPVDETLLYKALQMKGDWARRSRDFPLAADSYHRALALSTKVNGRDNEESVTLGHTLALALEDMGRYDEAIAELDRALAISNRLVGESGSRTLRLGEVAAVVEFDAGRIVEAKARLARLVTLVESHAPLNEPLLAEMRLNYAMTLAELGRHDEATPLLIEARDFLTAHEGSDPNELAETLSTLADIDVTAGRTRQAEAGLQQAQTALAAAKQDSALVEASLGHVRLLEGDAAAALELGREARDDAVKTEGERSYDTAKVHYYYGLALAAAGRDVEAEDEWRASLASYAAMLPPDGLHLESADVRIELGRKLAARAEHRDEGVRLLQQGAQLREQFFSDKDARALEARRLLADSRSVHPQKLTAH
jgi:eukaryotic-like serine/threonine-protein kinase